MFCSPDDETLGRKEHLLMNHNTDQIHFYIKGVQVSLLLAAVVLSSIR